MSLTELRVQSVDKHTKILSKTLYDEHCKISAHLIQRRHRTCTLITHKVVCRRVFFSQNQLSTFQKLTASFHTNTTLHTFARMPVLCQSIHEH